MTDATTTLAVRGNEWYPVYDITEAGDEWTNEQRYVVPEALVARWKATLQEFGACQALLRDIVDPPCPDCGHPGSRHQVAMDLGTMRVREPGTTRCLYRDYSGEDGSRGCRCTLPQPPNPNYAPEEEPS